MEIGKIIVHELRKQAGSSTVTRIESREVIPVNALSEGLIIALLQSYQGDRILYGQFDRRQGRYFPARFTQYQSSQRTEGEFIDFTISCLNNLEPLMQARVLATGGYLLFTEYINAGNTFTTIFLIRDTEGRLLRRTENSYEVRTIEYLDTNHLAMACRINETKLEQEEHNYLSFTSLKQAEVSEYFMNWICVEQLESSTEFTNSLYQIINGIPTPINSQTNEHYTIDEVRNMVFENARNNAQRNINLRTISEQVYGDPEIMTRYAEENQISIDTEFRYDKRALRRFVQLSINRDGINMKFSRGDIGNKVRISEESENTIIIESESFASELRNQIGNE